MSIGYELKKIIPDKLYIYLQYYKHFHKFPNLKRPKTFNEKLQWLKLYDRNPTYTQMVDKYEVRKYIAEKIGEEYLIPLYGVWEKVEDIDFDALPNQFVLKCTHDSGSVIICKDKAAFDEGEAIEKLSKALKKNAFYYGREWPYKNVKPRIIAEKYMEDTIVEEHVDYMENDQEGLTDYKFYCFDGKVEFLYVSIGLGGDHSKASISFITPDWKKAPFQRGDFKQIEGPINQPLHFDKMLCLAEHLSKNMPFIRVDFYEIQGKVYFSELTLYPCSGLMIFEPIEYDEIVGRMLHVCRDIEL